MALIVSTLQALLAPRRLVPIVLVSVPLVVAQYRYSPARDPGAVVVGLAMCLVFALIAPWLWRATATRGWLGLALYGLVGAAFVAVLGVLLPAVFGVGRTFLTEDASLLVALALFLVGGWGLGRDIDLEASLDRERARVGALAREAERAQLLALRSHLDPHFLFNTLNAIAEWCRTDGEVAERAVLRLSAMLRTILDGVRLPAWSLRRELDLCRDLFALHAVRDPGRFDCTVDGDPGDIAVPPLLLLPLAENAIKHGPAAGHRGPVRIHLSLGPSGLQIVIDNPGPFTGPRPGGEGLHMARRRLDLAYDGRADLVIGPADHGTRAVVTIPTGPPPTVVT
ncbi:sensor histidine kinase [Nannocystis bainbridge]|uniref:Histidine kinase n=1 Tax=Nannocystis bainbridge TaxID=2995303 RepID=A0ABT5DVF7_9BACT|nr:histidine kinase [Nannocystis bainbridge]MDC0717622.1 histidine kinase [Nannocystis bainbridge]